MFPKDDVLAVIPVLEASPIAYMNLYDPGDVWMKIQGCEECKIADQCCGNCPHRTPKGCDWHFFSSKHKDKPLRCCILPLPLSARKNCALVYKCTKGPKKGKYRYVTDKGDVLRHAKPNTK